MGTDHDFRFPDKLVLELIYNSENRGLSRIPAERHLDKIPAFAAARRIGMTTQTPLARE